MKKIIPIALVLVAFHALAAMPSPITVKAAKKTADSHHNTAAHGPRTVTFTAKDVYYEFELTTSSPAVPASVVAKWVVLTIGMGGHVHVGTKGEKEIALPKNKPVTVETDDFSLETKNVHGARGHFVNQSEAKVLGYAVRVFDTGGTLLSEEYSPDNEKKSLADAFDGKLKDVDEDMNPKRK